jgi:hypothetical protein
VGLLIWRYLQMTLIRKIKQGEIHILKWGTEGKVPVCQHKKHENIIFHLFWANPLKKTA